MVLASCRSLLYGSIGVEIAEAIAKSFGPEQGLYLPSGALLSGRDAKVQEMRDIVCVQIRTKFLKWTTTDYLIKVLIYEFIFCESDGIAKVVSLLLLRQHPPGRRAVRGSDFAGHHAPRGRDSNCSRSA